MYTTLSIPPLASNHPLSSISTLNALQSLHLQLKHLKNEQTPSSTLPNICMRAACWRLSATFMTIKSKDLKAQSRELDLECGGLNSKDDSEMKVKQ